MMSTLKKTYITLAITVITVFLGASTATAAYKTDVVSDMALIWAVTIDPSGRKTNCVLTWSTLLPMVVWNGFSTRFSFSNLQIAGR